MRRQRTKERGSNRASAYQGAWVECASVPLGGPCRDGAFQHTRASSTQNFGPRRSRQDWLSIHDRSRSSAPAKASRQARHHICSGISPGEAWAHSRA